MHISLKKNGILALSKTGGFNSHTAPIKMEREKHPEITCMCTSRLHGSLTYTNTAKATESGDRIRWNQSSQECNRCSVTPTLFRLLSSPFLAPFDISSQQCSIFNSRSATEQFFHKYRTAWMSKWKISPKAGALYLQRTYQQQSVTWNDL